MDARGLRVTIIKVWQNKIVCCKVLDKKCGKGGL